MVYLNVPDLIVYVLFLPAAVLLPIAGGVMFFRRSFRSLPDEKQEYRRITRLWVVLVFGTLYCDIRFVEVFWIAHPAFTGFRPIPSPQLIRAFLYGMALAELFALKSLRRSLQNLPAVRNGTRILWALRVWISVKGAHCIMPAIHGLFLFLSNGFYWDFYILVGYSAILGIVLFPRHKEWVDWQSRPDSSPG